MLKPAWPPSSERDVTSTLPKGNMRKVTRSGERSGATASGGGSGEGEGSWASLRAGTPCISAATATLAGQGRRGLQMPIDEPPISDALERKRPYSLEGRRRGYTFTPAIANECGRPGRPLSHRREAPPRRFFRAYLVAEEALLARPAPRLSQLRRAFQTRAWLPWVSQRHIGLLAKSTTCPLPTGQSTTAGRSASSSPLSSIPEIQRSSFFANRRTIRGRRSAGGRRLRTKSRISSGRSATVSGGVLGGSGGAT